MRFTAVSKSPVVNTMRGLAFLLFWRAGKVSLDKYEQEVNK
jgi:hypothetical protein